MGLLPYHSKCLLILSSSSSSSSLWMVSSFVLRSFLCVVFCGNKLVNEGRNRSWCVVCLCHRLWCVCAIDCGVFVPSIWVQANHLGSGESFLAQRTCHCQ
eukprot:102947_1